MQITYLELARWLGIIFGVAWMAWEVYKYFDKRNNRASEAIAGPSQDRRSPDRENIYRLLKTTGGIILVVLAIFVIGRNFRSQGPRSIPPDLSGSAATYLQMCFSGPGSWKPDAKAEGLLVVDGSNGEIYNTEDIPWDSFPNLAMKPEEVRYLGCFHRSEDLAGTYSGSSTNPFGGRMPVKCPGYKERLELTVFDLATGEKVRERFSAPPLPYQTKKCTENGRLIYSRVEAGELYAWLQGLMSTDIVAQVDPGQDSSTLPEDEPLSTPTAETPGLRGRIAFVSNRDGNPDIFVMNADGTGLQNLTGSPQSDDFCPSWSPDGKQIAYVSTPQGNLNIFVMNADGSNPHNLTPNAWFASWPAWSPDGKRIAFHATDQERDQESDIFVMDPDGTAVQDLTNIPGRDGSPDWSPEGSWIIFHSFRDNYRGIYRMNPDGTDIKALEPMKGNANLVDPTWSPDGTTYAAVRIKLVEGLVDVTLFDAEGTYLRNVPDLAIDKDLIPYSPCSLEDRIDWSPDGDGIAIAYKKDGNTDIYFHYLDGRQPLRLTDDPSEDYSPAWLAAGDE